MIAREDSSINENHTININGKRILRSASIYGANASGKSNFFNVLSDMFHNIRGTRQKLLGRPYVFDNKYKDEPVHSEIAFCIPHTDNELMEYRYGYSLNYNYEKGYCNSIKGEWLTARVFGSEENYEDVFVREGLNLNVLTTGNCETDNLLSEAWKIADSHNELEKNIQQEEKERTLFLSWLSNKMRLLRLDEHSSYQKNKNFFKRIQSIYNWCISSAPPYLFSDDEMKWQLKAVASRLAMNDLEFKKDAEIISTSEKKEAIDFEQDLIEFLHKFDTCINGVKIIIPEKYKGLLKLEDVDENHLRVIPMGVSEDEIGQLDETLMLKQSFGTQKIASVYRFFWEAWRNGGLIMVDELDTKLHPAVIRELVACFHSDATKYKGQLIYSSHNCVTLPNAIELGDEKYFMHPDEVYFTIKQNKDDPNPGYSTIERLVETFIVKNTEDAISNKEYRKKYESGDYGTSPDYFKSLPGGRLTS